MKKIYTLFACLSLFALASKAQNYVLSNHDNNTHVVNGQTLDIWDENTVFEMKFEFDCKNNTTQNKRIMMKRDELFLVGGTDNYLCWAQCYSPMVSTSLEAVFLSPQQSFTISSVHYRPNSTLGTSTIRYVFYDTLNVNDSVWFVVNWHTTLASVNQLSVNYTFSNAYPNPAINTVSFSYNLSGTETAYISVINMLGVEVKKIALSSLGGTATINVSDLPVGIYFGSLLINNKTVVTRKFTVLH